ncbi:MAG: hypothetical protein JJT96_17000 [Opitutales bacterium]|nr:hypothetical protein [Opitutales bacterium]
MKTKDISEAKDKDLRASMAALQRAAASARKTAIQTDTAIVIQRDGKLVRISAKELRGENLEVRSEKNEE